MNDTLTKFIGLYLRYELADDTSHHDHLICVECGDITEFEEPRLEALQEEIAKLHAYWRERYGQPPEPDK